MLESVHLPGAHYAIRRCDDCGHCFARGPVDSQSLTTVYGGQFHRSSQQDGVGENSPVVANARRRAAQLAGAGLRGRLLDIGAGMGHFVEAAAATFNAEGLEYSDTAASAARELGRPVQAGAFPAQRPTGLFEVITLWDVLAGFVDPHATMAAIRECLVPSGHLVFTAPFVSARFARWTGRRWPLWIPPVNLHYFTRGSLERLLRSHGLRIIACGSEPKRVAVDFLIRKALRSAGLCRWPERVRGIPASWSVALDLGDIVTVHAQTDQ